MGVWTLIWAILLCFKIAGIITTSWWIVIFWPLLALVAIFMIIFAIGIMSAIIGG